MITAGVHNLSSEAYQADPAPEPSLSSSIASILIDQSPIHAWLAHPRLNPNFAHESSSRFDLGSAAHMMLLESSRDKIVIVQADDWRTKAAKEARDAAQAQGNYAVLALQYDDIVEMVAANRQFVANTELQGIFETGMPERSLFWQEGTTWCRCRPDLISGDARVVVDYKTTDSAAPDAFAKVLGRLHYDLQAEHYLRGLTKHFGAEPTFVFLVQETSRPYACSLISLSNAYRQVGQLKAQRALDIWNRCMSSEKWPGYTPRVLYAEPPPWQVLAAEELSNKESDDGL